jgi:hypothetical protein
VRSKDKSVETKIENLAKSKTILVDTDEVPRLHTEFQVSLTLYSAEPEINISSNTEIFVYSETFSQVCTVGRIRPSSNLTATSQPRLERVISKSKDKKEPRAEKKKRSDSEVFIGTDLLGSHREVFSLALKSGETNKINLHFKFRSQFVRSGQRVVIYTPKIKAVGVVTQVFN